VCREVDQVANYLTKFCLSMVDCGCGLYLFGFVPSYLDLTCFSRPVYFNFQNTPNRRSQPCIGTNTNKIYLDTQMIDKIYKRNNIK